MARRSAAKRYARAAFDVAVANDAVEAWRRDLQTISEALATPQLVEYLQSPAVPFAPKRDLVDRRLASVLPHARNFVLTIVSNRRVAEFAAVVDEFETLAREAAGFVIARVTTAVPLDERESAAVADRLGAFAGRRVQMECTIDPEIIGGVIARIGDREIDGSVRARLAALRRELAM